MDSDTGDWYQSAVAEGVWLYDGLIERPMFIIEQNYDYFHSMYESEGITEAGEQPQLNADGKAFYLFFGGLPNARPYAVSSMGVFMSPQEAKAWTERNLPYFSRWL